MLINKIKSEERRKEWAVELLGGVGGRAWIPKVIGRMAVVVTARINILWFTSEAEMVRLRTTHPHRSVDILYQWRYKFSQSRTDGITCATD
jgi:hypothetical protein